MIAFLIERFGIKAVEYGVIVFLVVGGLSATYGYIHHQGVLAEKAKIEREKDNAIAKAKKARNRVQELCTKNPENCGTADDYRD